MSEIVFHSVKDAVGWAEEAGSKSDIKSQIGSLLKSGSGALSKDEIKDHALTITSAVNQCQAPMSKLFLSIYGHKDMQREITMAQILAEKSGGKGVKPNTVYPLVLALIESERKRHHTQKTLSRPMIAKIAGVPYQTFRGNKWHLIEQSILAVMYQWLEMAEREITLELQLLGYVS